MHIYVRSVIVYKVEDHISDKACTINLQCTNSIVIRSEAVVM